MYRAPRCVSPTGLPSAEQYSIRRANRRKGCDAAPAARADAVLAIRVVARPVHLLKQRQLHQRARSTLLVDRDVKVVGKRLPAACRKLTTVQLVLDPIRRAESVRREDVADYVECPTERPISRSESTGLVDVADGNRAEVEEYRPEIPRDRWLPWCEQYSGVRF
jgi:hypothetical protein